jgi:peptidoglycan/LPS O-acetylase OafA/YrhL
MEIRRGASTDYIPSLDGLRAVAILLVVMFHALRPPAPTPPPTGEALYAALASWGWSGVDLFFVLSGFLITGILLDSKGSRGYFRRFYARRVLRIFPLYYGVLFGLFVLLRPWLAHLPEYRVSLGHQVWFWTYAHNWWMGIRFPDVRPLAHFWSLAVEEQFYLVWPLIVWWSTPAGLLRWCAALVGGALGLRLLLVLTGVPVFVHSLTACRIDALSIGALLAIAWRTDQGQRRLARWAGPAGGLAAGALLVLALLRQPKVGDPVLESVGLSLVALLFGAGLGAVLGLPADHWLSRTLAWAPARFLGRVSYGLYVFHWFVVEGLAKRWAAFNLPTGLANQLTFLAATLAISILLAAASWYGYERHFLALKSRFASPKEAGVRRGEPERLRVQPPAGTPVAASGAGEG